jgi:diaminopropionate ammonia-lyase
MGGVAAIDFHRRLPGYEPTPLVDAPILAAELGLSRLWLKVERSRFGLPSFKPLGASWSAYGLVEQRAGGFRPWRTLDDLRSQVAALRPLTLVTATAGNHGRAVAWAARQLGLGARVYVPRACDAAASIRAQGAEVIETDADYDNAVITAAGSVGAADILVADATTDPDDLGARLVIDGYRTLFAEVDEAVAAASESAPDWIAVPVGVGGLAAAACAHYPSASVLGVEPESAACVAASLRAGHPVSVDVPASCTLHGIACGTPSAVAWPFLERLAQTATISDDEAASAARDLADLGVCTTATGAAAVAGLRKTRTVAGVLVVVITE